MPSVLCKSVRIWTLVLMFAQPALWPDEPSPHPTTLSHKGSWSSPGINLDSVCDIFRILRAQLKPSKGWMKCTHHRIWRKILKCHTVRDNLAWHTEHSPGADVTRARPNFGLHFSPTTQMAKPLSASAPPSIKWEWQQCLPNWVVGKLNQFSSVKHVLPGSSDHRNIYCTSEEKLSCQLGVTETKGILGMSSHPKWKSETLLDTPTNSCVDFWKCGNSEGWCLICASCKELPGPGQPQVHLSQPAMPSMRHAHHQIAEDTYCSWKLLVCWKWTSKHGMQRQNPEWSFTFPKHECYY